MMLEYIKDEVKLENNLIKEQMRKNK